jgi:hypothetical protein
MQMRRIRIPRPSPAMVVACLALLISLGGTSYATINALAANTVGTEQLKDNAVTSAKVRDFSLRLWDFKSGQLPRGPAGPQGPPGVIADLIPHQSSVTVPANRADGGYRTRSIQVRCASGEHAVAGGTFWSSEKNDEPLVTAYSRPLIEEGKAVGWRARGGSDLNADRIFTVQVLCAK